MKPHTQPNSSPRTHKDYVRIALCGFAMGTADVIPGVSGGTMAFILGIYEELIAAIRSLTNPQNLKLLSGFRIKEFIDSIPWKFLSALLFGILLAVFSLARLFKMLLEDYPELVWSFFFGLVVASIITVCKKLHDWNRHTISGIITGSVGAYIVVGLVPITTPNAPWFLFLCGCIAICAMILPGISGSFILVLLGKYTYVITAVTKFDLVTLTLVASGCVVGITSFAQVLGWLFKRYHNETMAILIGLMIGSLRKVWPWKHTVTEMLDRHGNLKPMEQLNILPTDDFAFALILAIVGFVCVSLLDFYGSGVDRTKNVE